MATAPKIKPARNVPEYGIDPVTLEVPENEQNPQIAGRPNNPPPPSADRTTVEMAGERSLKFEVDRPGTMKAAGGFRIDYSKNNVDRPFSLKDAHGGTSQHETLADAQKAAGQRLKDLRAMGLIEDEK